MDLDILLSLLPRAVSVYDLSARFPISDITRLQRLGFICRVGDDYCITASGKLRIIALSDLADDIRRSVQQFSQQDAKQREQHIADSAQAAADKQQERRDLYISTVLGAALALLLEHLPDLVNLVQLAVEKALSFLH